MALLLGQHYGDSMDIGGGYHAGFAVVAHAEHRLADLLRDARLSYNAHLPYNAQVPYNAHLSYNAQASYKRPGVIQRTPVVQCAGVMQRTARCHTATRPHGHTSRTTHGARLPALLQKLPQELHELARPLRHARDCMRLHVRPVVRNDAALVLAEVNLGHAASSMQA